MNWKASVVRASSSSSVNTRALECCCIRSLRREEGVSIKIKIISKIAHKATINIVSNFMVPPIDVYGL